MFSNYFRVAFRSFRHNKLFSLINIGGLAIGISAALVIYLIVQYEFSFDKFHKDGDRIYRVVSEMKFPDLTIENSGVPAPTSQAVREEATGLDLVTHFNTAWELKVSVPIPGNQSPAVFRKQKEIIYADKYYFEMFPYQWLAGSPKTALKDPFQVVLTESRAKTYFSALKPSEIIGREIYYDDTIKTMVAGVVKDMDKVTDFIFKEFISKATIDVTGWKEQWGLEEWGSITSASQMFVKLSKGASTSKIEQQLVSIREKYRSKDKEKGFTKKDDMKHMLQPITDIHFNNKYDAFSRRQAHLPTLYGLLAVAAFLLLLGCINFINLTTAQSSQRAKEIGIRKTMGSGKGQLIFQFLSETFLLTFLATLVSVALTPLLLNIFKDFIPEGISFTSLNQPHVWVFLLVLLLIVSALAGFYPALVLTKFKPVTVLKNQAYTGSAQSRKAWLRKTLTVTQFVIAQFLIIATLVVSKQINYSLNKDLGYKREAIVTVNTPRNFFSKEVDNRRFVLLEKLKAIPGIEKVSLAGSSPASSNTHTNTMKYEKADKSIMETMVEVKYADTGYFNLYGMKLVAGRNVEASDTTREYVINESLAKMIGHQNSADAVGEFLGEEKRKFLVVGVISDFHTKSTHEPIKPLLYSAASDQSFTLHLALKPKVGNSDSWKETLAMVEKEYKTIYPEEDFKFNFYDESISAFYKTEQNITRLLKWSSGLCIFISCLGLLGLAIYVTNTRTKEIGVRKVLGASVVQIVSLLSKDFIALVMIAFVIVLPLAWWAMHNWLQDFVYRTALSWWIFGATGFGMVLIAMLILSVRTIRAATENPVRSLRSE
ncbi:MAG: ABC transporter permease [Chitinophagaceae bacterium]|nr:ABC transporter permease [Chitinophagaceae bacterium]